MIERNRADPEADLARQALLQSLSTLEARLRDSQRLAHIGSWELDLVENRPWWSEEVHRIFEVDSSRFGASYGAFLELVHPDDQALVDRSYAESLATRAPYSIEHRLRFPDGRIEHVHERCETFYDARGQPLRSIGTVQNISERRLIEDALRRSEFRLREAQRVGRTGSFEVFFDGRPGELSDECYRILDRDPGSFDVTLEALLGVVHPDDVDLTLRAFARRELVNPIHVARDGEEALA